MRVTSELRLFSTLLGAAAIASCASQEAIEAPQTEFGAWGIDLEARDLSVLPGDDFHAYASGTWLAMAPIPDDQQTVSLLDQRSDLIEGEILTSLSRLQRHRGDLGPTDAKLMDIYEAWSDQSSRDAVGVEPLRLLLDRIDNAVGLDDLTTLMAEVYGPAPFQMGIIADPVDPSRYIAFVVQAGLGMGDREYYLSDESSFGSYQTAYKEYLESVFQEAGYNFPELRAQSVFELERQIAEVQWSQAQSLEVEKIYNPMSPEKLAATAPGFDWSLALDHRGLGDIDTVLLVQPTAIASSIAILRDAALGTAKDYLRFHLLNAFSADLTSALDEARFSFYERALRGVDLATPKGARAVRFLNGAMGEAVGKAYVETYFPESSRQEMIDLTKVVIDAFEQRLADNPWMDEPTRAEALTKLRLVEPRVGYPDQWIDYQSLQTSPTDHLGNRLALIDFEWKQELQRLGGPVDRERWVFPPQVVSAYYDAQVNQITLLAGMLQPPVFDPAADASVNFGAIGAIIGHELGHGFDSTGRMFDGEGVLRDWWTEQADRAFREREQRLIDQYSTYEVAPGVLINGALTISENIGDLGGLEIAYTAYRNHLDDCCDGQDAVLNGLTGDQRFFLAWAQMWRGKSREDALRNQVLTAEHSPLRYRVNGVVRNMDAWYRAFGVQPGDAMYLPEDKRVRIW